MNQQQLAHAILVRGWELISAPGGWMQGSLCDGPFHEATCFCSMGATYRARHELTLTGDHTLSFVAMAENRANGLLNAAAQELNYKDLIDLNDESDFDTVHQMWWRALDAARDAVNVHEVAS